ncbi:hypothetical protein TraAM80_08816 [Trypanosoma rangeli]|uniref:Uncharacterized protein n=1 Tax=Trypanosoma rangeli TaxID=5698 RepID=A0A422MYU6_TRYRA|nr:uncharacterized protein TraAM80_08816 [Trypanosoma rangeli]RNE98359.1 hypothetical protein TraAM80_08816 [Trypanosoma rangeli]|eukprot:RNE98359.1 hypothetical protein TraAM80_08816 [Trypanosoma rangeli]
MEKTVMGIRNNTTCRTSFLERYSDKRHYGSGDNNRFPLSSKPDVGGNSRSTKCTLCEMYASKNHLRVIGREQSPHCHNMDFLRHPRWLEQSSPNTREIEAASQHGSGSHPTFRK